MTVFSDLDVVHHWCTLAAQAALDKKATDPIVLDVGDALAITDAFLITSAGNDRQVRTIVEEVEAALKRAGGPAPIRVEGLREGQWVLMDYGDFVVHVFLQEMREFYDLEHLWSGAPRFAPGALGVAAAT
jgi:ribosome-associated protein